ncbi:unnamed protein product [Pleuronectes platessa]|uniref:Uncharacterized protein n=1 Tax=Pleuronectes platessa TaxID=8262 RepID=A0A9N7VVY3_PLEPL|nr:unnamed protein product [Pleuronectes platessa]
MLNEYTASFSPEYRRTRKTAGQLAPRERGELWEEDEQTEERGERDSKEDGLQLLHPMNHQRRKGAERLTANARQLMPRPRFASRVLAAPESPPRIDIESTERCPAHLSGG